jgi:hypothetical protein
MLIGQKSGAGAFWADRGHFNGQKGPLAEFCELWYLRTISGKVLFTILVSSVGVGGG